MNKKIIIILTILCVAIVLRASGLNKPLYQDDTIFANIAENKDYFSTNNVHLPLGNLIIIGATSLLGISEWALRLPTLIFAIGTIGITYFFARRKYGEKVALWATGIMSISCWSIYGSLTNIAAEGGLVTFMITITSFYFLEAKDRKGDIITGLLLGGAILAKEFAVLLLPIFMMYMIANKVSWKEIGTKITCTLIGAMIVGIIFVSIDFFWNNLGAVQTLLGSVVKETYTTPTFYHTMYGLFKITLFASPLLLLCFPLYVLKNGEKSFSEFEVLYTLFMFFFFIFGINQATEKVRYLLITVPFLAIIAAKYIAEFEMKKREYMIIAGLSIIFLISFALMNIERNSVSYEEQSKIVESIKSGKGIDIGMVSETGNSGFAVNANIVILAYVLSIFALISMRKWKVTGILIFLALGIGYNLFIAEEYLWHGTSPNYEEVTQNIIQDLKEEKAKEPIYVIKDVGIIWYLQDDYETFYSLDTIQNTEERLDWFEESVKEKGGTVVVVDIPFINKEGRLWRIIKENCINKKMYGDKEIEIGWVFSC